MVLKIGSEIFQTPVSPSTVVNVSVRPAFSFAVVARTTTGASASFTSSAE